MIEFVKLWLALKVDRRAVTALEYGLIAALIAVVIISALSTLGGNLTKTFNTIAKSISGRMSASAVSLAHARLTAFSRRG